jgi:cell division protein FtsB
MEENMPAQSHLIATPEETVTLENYLAEILRLRSEIEVEQEEIERLKADNRDLKAETRALLTTLKATILT